MEAQSQLLWDFLRLSFQRGLMDDLMALGDLLNPQMDLVDALESFEEAVMAMDLQPFSTAWQGQIQPLLKGLTNPQAIDALRAILNTLRPFLVMLTADGSGGAAVLQAVQALAALKPHLAVLLSELRPLATPFAQELVRENGGKLLGRGLNAVSAAITQAHARQPELVAGLCADLFHTLDAQQLGGAMEIVLNSVLDQRPKVVRWALGTTFLRIKKRFARS